jgi:formylglycine-generating enzyme required for sulfatase activity
VRVDVRLPASVPEGYVFVPAGRFLYGTTDGEDMRRLMLTAQPQHPVVGDAFLIARHEVTFGDWMDFLRALAPAERRRRLPSTPAVSALVNQRVALRETALGFRLLLQPTTEVYAADVGEPIVYPARTRRRTQDWLRMPVSGISWADAQAYAAWLDRSGRLPGARLCDEHEWERAARGADDRLFPSGDRLRPDDANVDETYGRLPLAFGPDEVGAHPVSDSPFGVADLSGSVWELVASVSGDEAVVLRGGSWYQGQIVARADNREPADPSLRAPLIGTRICATVAP